MAVRKDTHECEDTEVSILFHACTLELSNSNFVIVFFFWLLLCHIDDGINIPFIRYTASISHWHCRLVDIRFGEAANVILLE
jgi:hypothetical protein